jgi:transposase-like protein
MEKKDDLSLLELQSLALQRSYGRSFEKKRMIVSAYLVDHVPISQLVIQFGVPKGTIYRWISNFADGKVPEGRAKGTPDVKPNPSNESMKSQKPTETQTEELVRLREENKRLAEALKMSEWMNHAKDVMIDEAEKMFNIPIRKKAGAKQ